jgi:peptidoglycan/xylan/chitin deacetylase (PgdA/CDA1 family)
MNIVKETLLRVFSFLGLPQSHAVILMYHSISHIPNYFSAVTPEAFEAQMVYLAKRGYPVISLAELVRRLEKKEPLGGSVVITFDDGYRDNYTEALPVLKRYGFPATIFVSTDLVGKADKRNLERLSVKEMQELKRGGVLIEPHSKSHLRLGELSTEDARTEVLGSKQTVEAWLGKRTAFFAYPYGSYNKETERIVKEGGFSAAATVKEGTVHQSTNPYQLPRISINSSTTLGQFKGKLSRAVDLYESIKNIV